MRLPFVGFVLGTSLFAITLCTFSACSGGDPRPDAGSIDTTSSSSGNSSSGNTSSGGDSSIDTGLDTGTDVEVPPTCMNTIRDGNETDVDCGGNVCAKCFDGKSCIANTDCAGGACLNNVCVTPQCTDKATNGDETDIDCGGALCARCTIGKRCTTGKDCVSGACTTTGSCACPKGMTSATKAGGNGAYCIDQIEVSKFHYEKFFKANVDVNDQISVCKGINGSFYPRGAWPIVEDIPGLAPGEGTTFNNALPVHYVDWCDAYAYCRWAGKQLCGGVAGGTVAVAQGDKPDASAWHNACSGGGDRNWPYAPSFDTRCNGSFFASTPQNAGPQPQRSGYGHGGDQGIQYLCTMDPLGNCTTFRFADCAGAVAGDLFQMSGNVAEWEDSCDGVNPDSKCRVRGGSFFADNDAGTLSCTGMRMEQRVPPPPAPGEDDPLRDIGFRCCLY